MKVNSLFSRKHKDAAAVVLKSEDEMAEPFRSEAGKMLPVKPDKLAEPFRPEAGKMLPVRFRYKLDESDKALETKGVDVDALKRCYQTIIGDVDPDLMGEDVADAIPGLAILLEYAEGKVDLKGKDRISPGCFSFAIETLEELREEFKTITDFDKRYHLAALVDSNGIGWANMTKDEKDNARKLILS